MGRSFVDNSSSHCNQYPLRLFSFALVVSDAWTFTPEVYLLLQGTHKQIYKKQTLTDAYAIEVDRHFTARQRWLTSSKLDCSIHASTARAGRVGITDVTSP